jgi:pimeloyl-ACP methyl ester carboxylesterase
MKKLLIFLSLMTSFLMTEVATAAPVTLESAPTQFVDAGGTHFAYRILGPRSGVPLVLLQHFTGTIDYWDPAVINALAEKRPVIVFDNTGVGASSGKVPDNVDQMATDAVAFVTALKLDRADLLGYSLGGMVAQVIAAKHPELVRKVILASTAHQGGGNNLQKVLQEAFSQKTYPDPRMVLFFTKSDASIAAGQSFLKRAGARQSDRDPESRPEVAERQAKAIIVFSTTQDPANTLLLSITQPVLVVTGSNDTMLPTESSYAMSRILKNAQLVIYPDSNHGAIFQYHTQFVTEVNEFLDRS